MEAILFHSHTHTHTQIMRRDWIVVCWGGNGSLCLLTCIPVSWHQWWRDATGPAHIHSSPRILWLGNYLHRKLNEKVKPAAKQSESDTLLRHFSCHLCMLLVRVWWDWWVAIFRYIMVLKCLKRFQYLYIKFNILAREQLMIQYLQWPRAAIRFISMYSLHVLFNMDLGAVCTNYADFIFHIISNIFHNTTYFHAFHTDSGLCEY